MEVMHPRCAGLDVHKDTVVACVRNAEGRKVERTTREFGTTTRQLLALADWLGMNHVTHAAMESTGVYWKPVWHVLDGTFELTLGNAQEIRNVPGRKSDWNDAMWIADLHAHGLIRGSFVPPQPIQELRDLTRTRKQLMHERGRHVQRIQKVLEDANIKLSSVLTDLTGVSGHRMLAAIIQGESDGQKLAALADPRVKAPRAQIAEAMEGHATAHHRFMISLHLGLIQALDQEVTGLESRIGDVVAPFRRVMGHLCTIPGVKEDAAAAILAEIGPDMAAFGSPDRLVAWAGLSPGLNRSAKQSKSTRTKKQRWLKATMTQCAWAATKQKECYLGARYRRIRSRRGNKKAVIAVAATMLRAIYHMILNDTDYHDLGPTYWDRIHRERTARNLTRRLQSLGYEVDLRTAA
jgi:transposase